MSAPAPRHAWAERFTLLIDVLVATFIAYSIAVVTIPLSWAAITVMMGQIKIRDTWIFVDGITLFIVALFCSPTLLLFPSLYFGFRVIRYLSMTLLIVTGGFVGFLLGSYPAVLISRSEGAVLLALSGANVATGAVAAFVAARYMRWVDPRFGKAR